MHRVKERNTIFFSSGSNFRAITRLQTLATEASGGSEERKKRGSEVRFWAIFFIENHLCEFIRHIVQKSGKIIETVVQGKELNTALSTEVQ